MEFTREQIIKASGCKSVEELLALAKEAGIDFSLEDAQKYFAQLSGKALNLEELGDVAGGCVGNACGANISMEC